MNNRITALTADAQGNIFDVPQVEAVGRVDGNVTLHPMDAIKFLTAAVNRRA